MSYIRENARFSILDNVPADVWDEGQQDPNRSGLYSDLRGTTSDPERYLCIVSDEPADYYGNFIACTFTAATYQDEHVAVSAEYLKTCTLAPEATARKILAFYIRNWANIEDEDTAELLRDEADRIANA